ncbi:MAG TPA: aldo/keto reductase [Chthonomonadaceae bacterium]|nr:aldo/keto reductase [Chthonomonadaceae bacterium]
MEDSAQAGQASVGQTDRTPPAAQGLWADASVLSKDALPASASDFTPLPMTHTGPNEIPQKPLGRTGVTVSILGIGGATLGNAASLQEATAIVHKAVDAGVTFMDNAWEYNQGRSEDWMGQALQGRREKVFLMTKVCTHGRDARVAMQQLEESLRRLRTDHLDLWQIHEVIYFNDPDLHFAPGGAVEALLKAKQQGKTRFIGFTGHKNPMIHLRMLELADQHNVHFDAVQMPLSAFDATFRSFEQHVLPEAIRRGIGALGMKSMGGGGEAIQEGAITPEEALRYALSLPVATTISGIDSLQVLRQNLAVARGFQPMTAQERQDLRSRCANAAADGHLELYKTTKHYDGAVGREQHGYPPSEKLPL